MGTLKFLMDLKDQNVQQLAKLLAVTTSRAAAVRHLVEVGGWQLNEATRWVNNFVRDLKEPQS